MDPNKRREEEKVAFHEAEQYIKKAYGRKAIVKGGHPVVQQFVDVESKSDGVTYAVTTGHKELDDAIGRGGLPRGRVTELYGGHSSGKTTIMLDTIAAAQKRGEICAVIDAEHTLDCRYAESRGVDIGSLIVCSPPNLEAAFGMAQILMEKGRVHFIGIDTLASMVPKSEWIQEYERDSIPQVLPGNLRKITHTAANSKCVVLILNHSRVRRGSAIVFGSPLRAPGHSSMEFFSSVRIELRRVGSIKEGEEVVGQEVRARITKNKVSAPHREANFEIRLDRDRETKTTPRAHIPAAFPGAWQAAAGR